MYLSRRGLILMKSKLKIAAIAAVATVLGMTTAQAEDGSFYVSVGGGVNWIDEVSGNNVTLDFETGYTALIAGGYDFGVNNAGGAFRVEGEFSYTNNGYEEGRALGVSVPISGDVEQYGFMVNALYDFFAEDSFSPYIGVGVGVVDAESKATVGNITAGSDATEIAYRGLAGVAFDVTDSMALDLGFRFTSVDTNQTIDNSAIVAQVRFGL